MSSVEMVDLSEIEQARQDVMPLVFRSDQLLAQAAVQIGTRFKQLRTDTKVNAARSRAQHLVEPQVIEHDASTTLHVHYMTMHESVTRDGVAEVPQGFFGIAIESEIERPLEAHSYFTDSELTSTGVFVSSTLFGKRYNDFRLREEMKYTGSQGMHIYESAQDMKQDFSKVYTNKLASACVVAWQVELVAIAQGNTDESPFTLLPDITATIHDWRDHDNPHHARTIQTSLALL